MQAQGADYTHDDARHNDTQGYGDGGLADAHVQEAGGQSTGPGAGAGQGNTHEDYQRDEQAAFFCGAGGEFFTAAFSVIGI